MMRLLITCLLPLFAGMRLVSGKQAFSASTDTEQPAQDPVNLQDRKCSQNLGMESGDIADDQISVSASISGLRFGKENARLNGDSAWVTYTFPEPWIQINLEELMLVSGVRTQGKLIPRSGQFWISSYQVQYKTSEASPWKTVSRGLRHFSRTFTGNIEPYRVKTNYFDQPIQAQIVKIVPKTWPKNRRRIALRLELIGCNIEPRSGCQSPRILTNPTGTISSMNYPKKYDNNANCTWEIVAPPEQTIVLQFDEGFALEAGFNCWLENVEVFDYHDDVATSLDKLCGKEPPQTFYSTNNKMKVKFMSDHYETDTGFQAHYKFVNGSNCGGPRVLTDASGKLYSMHYPSNYDNNVSCVWDITVDEGMVIEVTFTDMQIPTGVRMQAERIPSCPTDSVQMLDYSVSKLAGRKFWIEEEESSGSYCGRVLPKPFLSSTNKLKITFQSDHHITDRGFSATYQAVPASGCGGKRNLIEASGTIKTLHYPKMYPAGLRCEWNILGQQNQDIQISFIDFELEEDTDCRYDFVSIYDGLTTEHLLAKYCSSLKFPPLLAHSGAMKIVFGSDDYNPHRGFKAAYSITTRTAILRQPKLPLPQTTEEYTTKAATTTESHDETTEPSTQVTTKEEATTILSTTIKSTKSTKHTVTYTSKSSSTPSDIPESFVTEEMAKWIIVGLASISGLLIVLVLFGIVLCCRPHLTRSSMIVQGSAKNANNSSVMQNHAYDFSIASTNHSIRSRQVEQPESSQVSENFSHQGTLQRAPSCESHIYFSIEECRDTRKKHEVPVSVHFKKHANAASDESATAQSEEDMDEDDYYDEEDLESGSTSPETYNEVEDAGRMSRHSTMEHTTISSQQMDKKQGPKMMVNNILYESADSMDQD